MENIVSAKDVMKYGMRGYKDCINYNWHGVIISIRHLLPREELRDVIYDIFEETSACNDIAGYEFVDFVTKVNIIIRYTNVELPEDISDMYKLIYYSDLFDIVATNANKAQINVILKTFGMDQ